jgi:predicted amidohydrolase YtcJ
MSSNSAAATMCWPEIGTLTAGNYADYIVLDRDPGTCAVDDIAGTQVLQTVLAGEAVYDRGVS